MRVASMFGALAFLASSAVPAQPRSIPWIYAPSSPTADYVTSGQDEPGYRRWSAQTPQRTLQVAMFHQYLSQGGVAYVVPTWQLLRTASDWQKCGSAPFEVPPPGEWANLIQTLRFIRDYVIPAVGPVEPVSAYRNPLLNHCAGGAPESVHMHFAAIDMVPLRPIGRAEMIDRLCFMHHREGGRYQVGLGFYSKLRFHVDSAKSRTWGRNDAGSLACPMPLAAAPRPTDLAVLQATSGSGSASASASTSTSTSASASPMPAPVPVQSLPPRDPLAPLIPPPR